MARSANGAGTRPVVGRTLTGEVGGGRITLYGQDKPHRPPPALKRDDDLPHYYDHDTGTEVMTDYDDGKVWVILKSYVGFSPNVARQFGQALIDAADALEKRNERTIRTL